MNQAISAAVAQIPNVSRDSCPRCLSVNKTSSKVYKICCAHCKGYWCWNCKGMWKGNGQIVCGNYNCRLIKDINQILRDARIKKITYCEKSMAPEIRACPSCLTVMENIDKGKHMICHGCAGRFCLICLGQQDKSTGKWPCGSYNYDCMMAPIQQLQ
eukprot:UN03019